MSAEQERPRVFWEDLRGEFDLVLRELWDGLLEEGAVWLSPKDA